MDSNSGGRPFKRIWGVAYKNIIRGDNPTREITASDEDRDQLYNDPAIRLSEEDLKRFRGLRGKPICVEHDPDCVVGHIHFEDVDDEDGHLRVAARIYTDCDEGLDALAQLQQGNLTGLSVGYTTSMIKGTRNVASKTFNELTLTKEPFFEGCRVTVQASHNPVGGAAAETEKKNLASKESTYNTEVLWITLSKQTPVNMSDSTAQTPNQTQTESSSQTQHQAPPQSQSQSQTHAQTQPVPQKDASSLLKVADGLQEQVDEAKANADKERSTVEELRKQLEDERKKTAYLADFKQREEAAYAKAKEAEAKDTLATLEEMNRKPFPENVQKAMVHTMCSKDPIDIANTEIMCSQASAYKAEKEGRIKLEEEKKSWMEEKAKFAEESEMAQQRINASRAGVRELYGARPSEIQTPRQHDKGKGEESDIAFDVNASRGGDSTFSGSGMAPDSFFPNRGNTSGTINVPQASPMELNLPYFRKTPAATVEVTASRDRTGANVMVMNAAPLHSNVDELPFSMRNARNAHWFSMMVAQPDSMMRGPDVNVYSAPERFGGDGQRKRPDWSKDGQKKE